MTELKLKSPYPMDSSNLQINPTDRQAKGIPRTAEDGITRFANQ